jgi:hypothetical protein
LWCMPCVSLACGVQGAMLNDVFGGMQVTQSLRGCCANRWVAWRSGVRVPTITVCMASAT